MRCSTCLPLTALLLFRVSIAQAEPRDAATADELFRRAKELRAAGDLDRACAALAESQRLDPATGTLLNLADCEEAQGKLASARQHFMDARAQLADGDYRVAFADERIAALASRVPMLAISVSAGAASGARVFRDDTELGAAALGIPLSVDPGPHVIRIRAEGHAEGRVDVTLTEGEHRALTVDVGQVERRATVEAGSSRPSSNRTLAYVLGGVGAASLAVGVVASVVTVNAANRYDAECKNGRCTPDGLDAAATGRTFEVVAPVALAAGVVSLVASTWLFFTGAKLAKRASGMAVVPRGSTGFELTFGRSF